MLKGCYRKVVHLRGALAQLGEHLLCKQGVVGSIPTGSTMICDRLGGGEGPVDLFEQIMPSPTGAAEAQTKGVGSSGG